MPTLVAQIDRTWMAELHARERAAFVDLHPRSAEHATSSSTNLLGGVPMPWMNRWPGSFPLFFEHASGAGFVDVDGIEYLDFCLGDTGAMCGHALPQVAEAIEAQARRGITTMMPTGDASWVGEELARRFGLPTWQMAMTATDANRFVLRFARHLTGRPKVLVFDWCYHGTVDESFATLDATGAVSARAGTIGPPVDPSLTTRVVQFNDLDALDAALSIGDVAVVLAEPAMTNIGIVLPDPGYWEAAQELIARHGALLAIDETHTICCGPGGATAEWGLRPDFLIIGKTIGGGMPAAAYGMTAALADRLAPDLRSDSIDVSGVGGTLTGNALAMAAVRATLSTCLLPDQFAATVPLAERWAAGVQDSVDRHALPWCVQRLGCRAEYWFCPPPRTGRDAAAAVDAELDAFFHLYCLNRGILMTPFHNMALLSPSHTAADVDRHTAVFAAACAELVGA